MKPDAPPGSSSSGARRIPAGPPPAIPDYQMLRRIGGGSYGEVWLARDVLGNYRAVKVVHRGQFNHDRPFEREFEGIRNFEPVSRSHPSQVSLFHVGRNDADGYFYYVMELADDQRTGQQIDPERYEPKTLRSELRQRGRLPVAGCLKVGLTLTTALKHLHGAGLIHRDIKPSNVIFVHGLPKLADIGLVAAAGDECSFVGTEGYVAGEGPGKAQADIFALGKVLYEMLTGLRPERYPSLPEEWGKAPDRHAQELNEVVVKACAANVAERYQSAAELETDLELLKSGKSLVRLRRIERAYRRLLVFAGVAIGVFILGGFALGFFVFQNRAAEQNLRRELREIQLSRLGNRRTGWFTNSWARLEQAAAIRMDQEVTEQASAVLAGLDARPVNNLFGTAGASAAFSPDGRALVGGVGPDGPALLIDTNGAMTELSVRGEGPVCWTPEGVPLQLTAVSNRLVLREAMTGNVRREFPFAGAKLFSIGSHPVLALTPDGRGVAAGMGDRVLVWQAAGGDLPGAIPTHATALAFSPDGSLLGVGGADGTTRVYAFPSLAEVAVLPPALRGSPVLCLAFGRDPLVRYGALQTTNSWLLATGDQGAGIVIWDLARRLPRTVCRGSTWIVTALAFHPDGVTLVSAGRNDPVIWDVTSGQSLLRLRHAGAGECRALAFDYEGRRLVCGSDPGDATATVGLWEWEPHHGVQVLRGLASPVRKLWFSADSTRVAALSDDWHLAVWELASGRLFFLFETPVGLSYTDSAGACFDASGNRLAFASGHEACLYDLATGNVVQAWHLATGWSDQLQFDARGRLLLLRREHAGETRAWLWRLYELGASGSPVLLHQQKEINGSVLGLAFVPGGEQFLAWDDGSWGATQAIRVLDVASGNERWRDELAGPAGDLRVCFDPGGRWFGYTAYHDARLRLMRFSGFQEIGTTAEDYDAISPSGQEFAVDAANQRWLHSDRAGPQHGRLPLATDWTALSWVSAFSPNGKLVAKGTEEGAVLVADIRAVRERLSALGR